MRTVAVTEETLEAEGYPPLTRSSAIASSHTRKHVKPEDLRAWLHEQDCSFIASDELATVLGVPEQDLPDVLIQAVRDREMLQITATSWAPTSPQGSFPHMGVLDVLMRHLDCAYYIGWMSAGQIHGASHYRSARLMVAVEHEVPELLAAPLSETTGAFRELMGRMPHYLPVVRPNIANIPCEFTRIGPGANLLHAQMGNVSTTAATLLDCVDRPDLAGGMNNLANIAFAFLAMEGYTRKERRQRKIPSEELAEVAMLFPPEVRQRCGYLLSRMRRRALKPWYPLRRLRNTIPRNAPIVDYGNYPLCNSPRLNRQWRVSVSSLPDCDW